MFQMVIFNCFLPLKKRFQQTTHIDFPSIQQLFKKIEFYFRILNKKSYLFIKMLFYLT